MQHAGCAAGATVWCAATCPLLTTNGGASGSGRYLDLTQFSTAPGDTSMPGLYGDSAAWIQASQGRPRRRRAANAWRELRH